MGREYRGSMRVKQITQASGAGGNTYCNIQPPEGELWMIHAISASHDDVARTISWVWSDSPLSLIATLYTEAAVTAMHYYHRDVGSAAPVQANRQVYPSFYVAAMAGAKTITVNVLYERIVGMPTWKAN